MQKSLSSLGVGLLSVGSIAVPSMAVAATNQCGPAETGKTLTLVGGVCQAMYSVAGSYVFAVPTGATELAAVIVGGGGGAQIYYSGGDPSDYYAGNGGSVKYLDISQQSPAAGQLNVLVGAGGISGSYTLATQGSPSSLDWVDLPLPEEASPGQVSGNCDNLCDISDPKLFYNGDGASGDDAGSFQPCSNLGGDGLIPSTDQGDNYRNSRPAIFATFNSELGAGGSITELSSPPLLGAGQGGSGNVYNSSVTLQDGSDGAVILRWKPVLALTGTNSIQGVIVGTVGVFMLALGGTLVAIANRAKRRAKQ